MGEYKNQLPKDAVSMKIQGVVVEGIAWDGEECHYKVSSAGGEYEIISSGRQATLDVLFVQEGQCMEIEGRKSEGEKNNLFCEKSRIELKKRKKKGE